MKNLSPKITFTFLILPYKLGGFWGMCKETGEIRHGETSDEVQGKLINATRLVIETVIKDEKYLPSLTIGLPWRYRFAFYYYLLSLSFTQLIRRAGHNLTFFTRDMNAFVPSHG